MNGMVENALSLFPALKSVPSDVLAAMISYVYDNGYEDGKSDGYDEGYESCLEDHDIED